MDENKWFFEENLLAPLQAASKEEAIEKLGSLLFANGYVKDSFVPAVIAREQEFATGLPVQQVGVAIPHTDAVHVLKQAVAVGILSSPVTFSEMGDSEDKPVLVRVILMLAVPDKNLVMGVLQRVIAIIQGRNFLNKLVATIDRAELVRILDNHLNAPSRAQVEPEKGREAEPASREITVTVQHPVGLHARPATLFVKMAKQFESNISVLCKGKEANAKSILRVLSLGADQGAEITIRAEGKDADKALQELRGLVESNFGGVS